ncbi:D-alanyl-D-alanine carboxypeptidase/D-alanyl-D-alanine endopeptidase [Puniceibacterium sediminis]|uniref:D-alanyl-D-alanine carboxypeptidase / D-alanyl-D-alanine-endopeptidase (Penicillin-binding protein 4) n=1 Tax=Puniceibacterium sediminis TaxID=1608407 RepID=A0A238ZET5_9RHOB|nr:D-alanyl-D-alanine carboxypeptidase/D-alanyl-D-alanine-endopeptidase [Puniceibacterium sediminis]SNR81639.1 D-alanyl-D-alanine carboxypeptidase / D-alanyl-D-alanine-endopeptidase (penicillin-binding protein 4) [Puniceibacterium sediminis]
MKHDLTRRAFLSALAASVAVPAVADAPLTSLRPVGRGEDIMRRSLPSVDALIAKARLDGRVGFAVANLASGEMLEELNGQAGLPPASVAKALTSSYALETLGPDHRFGTQVIMTGGLNQGVVTGDLVLAGGGDPTLDTNGLAELAAQLKEAGVREVRGRFLVWGGALPYTAAIDPDQPFQVGYNPAVCGLSLNYNRVHFEWRRTGSDYTVTMDARSDRYRPDVTMARMEIVNRAAPIYTYSDAGDRDEWTVARGALGSEGARWLPVRQPERYAGEVFQTFAGSQGIRLKAPEVVAERPEGRVVAYLESAPLNEILQDMLKWSTNLTAEMVGLATTTRRIGKVASLKESAEAMNAWAKESLGLTHVALVDHSGLGDDSRIAAADMMKVMLTVHDRLGLKPLLKSFDLRDSRRRVIPDHPIRVHAKTGTLNFVSGLAGFADLPDGTELAFAIFAANIPRRDQLSREERERPPGASDWNVRAKVLQQALIERWGTLYGA